MKLKIVALCLLLSFTANFSVCANAEHEAVRIYVSQDGADENDGSVEKPIKTMARAREIYRAKKGEDSSFTAEISVHAGVYRMTEALELTKLDSGMTINAYGDGEVIFRGSAELERDKFKKVTDAELLERLPENTVGKVYQYDLSDVILGEMTAYPDYTPLHGGTAYYELFSGGVAQNLARWPNNGYSKTGNVSYDGITFEVESDRLEKWKNAESAMVCGYFEHNWSFENIYIDDVDSENKTVTLARSLKQGSGVLKGKRFYVMNLPEEMDIPGEYYIDYEKKLLYYYPDGDFENENPELSILTDSMFFINDASNITIKNITIENTRGRAIYSQSSSDVTVDNCTIRNIGSDGVYLIGMRSTVKNCEIYNIGACGVNVTSGTNVSRITGGSVVTNNNIYNFGRTFKTYQPGVFLAGFGNTAEYNTIHDAPHCAVRFTGSENVITHNEIYSVVRECSDSSAIYCGRNWTYWGNEISYNYFHDINKLVDDTYTVSAVYMDDMLCGTSVLGNYFEKCSRAMFFGGGKGNVAMNNVCVDCDEAINYDERAVKGEWSHSSVVSGGEAYEGFMTFLNDEKLDIEVWKASYEGFSELVEDISAYNEELSCGDDIVTETGYPKNAVIKNNSFYGDTVNNSDYIYISEYAYTYGTVADNTLSEEKVEVEIPENGASERLWSNGLYVTVPEKSAVYEYGNIEFTWMPAGGADYYEVSIFDEEENKILTKKAYGIGCNVIIEEKGTYSWRVDAVGTDKMISQTGKFKVRKSLKKKGTYIAGSDFEAVTRLVDLKSYGWDYEVCDGDSITLEKDEEGNQYIKMVRAQANLESTSTSFLKLSFVEKSEGKITVTYDMKLDNFRGGWRDMGSLQTTDGSDIVRMLNHEKYVYGVKTIGAVSERFALDLITLDADKYFTVKRCVDLDNNTYEIWLYQDGKTVKHSSYSCPDGTAGSVMFRLGYQSPYEPYSGEGDAVYRIDNVHVDMGELSPIYTYPADEAEEVETDEEIKIKWNDEIDAASISESTVLVFKNNTELSESDYDVAICGNILKISFPDGMSYNSEYRVKLQNIESDSLSHTAMSEGYSFSFATKKSFKYDSDCSDEKITVTVIESPVENCICIAAQYGCLGRLLKVETKDCAINEVLEFGNEAGLKIYFWESRESMKPLCEALCY